MAIQPHSRIESQLTDPTYKGPYLSRIELILKDMLENYGRIAFVGPYDSLEDLPETGQAGYVYLVRVEGSNLCDEYIWDEQEEEYNYVGRFEIDLADYQTKDLSNPITIDSVVYTTVESALAAMNVSLSNVSRDALKKVSAMPQNPSNNDLVVWHGDNAYKVGHIYKYVEGTGETLYAWQVDNPGGVGDGTVIYTKSAIPDEDTNIYKSDGTAYSSSTDDPTYELMVGGESAITIEIFSLSQMQSWERSALRKSSEDIVATSGEWVEVTKDNIQDDWEQSDSSAPDYIKNKPTLGTAASRDTTSQITEGSTALPEAGAVKTALDSKEESGVAETLVKDTVGWTGKNKLPLVLADIKANNTSGTWSGNAYILNGVTFTMLTDSDDNVTGVKVNGTASAWASLTFGQITLPTGSYKISSASNLMTGLYLSIADVVDLTGTISSKDFTVSEEVTKYCYIGVSTTVSLSNYVFTPMVCLASATAPTSFEPYHATVDTVKADKVTNATSGHLAGLDSNGNLTDSGVSPTEEVTVEGNPVTFDSPFEQDAKSVVVSVKPIQDLHGYDHPWVGGAGKNKLPLTLEWIKANNVSGTWSGNDYTINNITYSIITDSGNNVIAIKANGLEPNIYSSPLFLGSITLKANETYILNGSPANGGGSSYRIYANNQGSAWYNNGGDTILPVQTEDLTINFVCSVYQNYNAQNVMFYPMIRLSTESDATFVPYSNECPISGHTEVDVQRDGRNLFDEVYPNISSDIKRVFVYVGDGEFTMSTSTPAAAGPSANLFFLAGKVDGGESTVDNGVTNSVSRTVTSIDGYVTVSYRNNGNVDPRDYETQIERGSTATPYEPYKGSTTTIPLPSTLYDADVDVTNGDADENSACSVITADDINNVNVESTGFFRVFLKSSKYALSQAYASAITNGYSVVTSYADASSTDGCIALNSAEGTVFLLHNNLYSTGTDVINGITNQPIQIYYPLATPTTISITPTDVELLEGTNVVSTNGEKVAVTYKAGILATLGDIDDLNDKVKTKFDKANVATIETGNTASKTYYKGDYIVRSDGCLYDVTATIASGAAFTNNNTHKTNLGDELNKFKVYVGTANSPVNGNDVASVSISGYLPISPLQVFSWTGSGTVSITPKSSGGTWNVSGDVSDVRYGQIFMRT